MNDPKQPKRRGQVVRVVAGPDAGRTAVIIQEPLAGSSTQTIRFENGRAITISGTALEFIGDDQE